uniref:Endonuclease exonuclease phosphatase domain containing protein n=1 Tax=Haemonchus contortus TaxID=6289 RepID=W6NEA0_HAECO
MLSKLLAFLSGLIDRSRTHQQWERILGKQFEIKEFVKPVSSINLKAAGKLSTYSTKQLKRSSMPMLMPQNSILLWKDAVSSRASERINFLSIMFDFHYNDNSLLVALRRPLSEPFGETAKKIAFKIQKMTAPQKNKKALAVTPPSGIFAETSGVAITIQAPNSASRIESMTLEEVMNAEQQIIIDSIPYTVIREPIDISSLSCAVKPLAGCPIYPAIDFRQGSPSAKPILHWYAYTPHSTEELSCNSKIKDVVGRETISMIEGSSRRFSVTNCEYRWTGDCYVPSAVDTGKLLFLVADLGPEAIVKSGVSKYPVEVMDESPIFEGNINWCQAQRPSESVRVVSYNILADLYLDLSGPEESLFFPYCPKQYQMYEYRCPLLLKELSSYDMDLCFLQEVDNRMQMRYLSALFDSMGMEMCFAKKQKEVTEGSIVAFRRERFELLFAECFGLATLLENGCYDDINSVLNTSNASLEIFSTRPTTIQVVVLRDRLTKNVVICGNTHLHHNPMHEHLKVFQAIVAVRQLDITRQYYATLYPDDAIRLLFAGDFNSTPDGPVYELISTGKLSKSSECWRLDEDMVASDLVLLPSGSRLVNQTGTDVTNYTRYRGSGGGERGFAGCLDYIWTDSTTGLHRIAPRPALELLNKYGALPSKIAPSDHIPLICELYFQKT